MRPDPARRFARDAHLQRVVVEHVTNLRQRAGGQQLASADEQDAVGQLVHLVQNVARHQHGFSLRGQGAEQLVQLLTADRVDAVKRFVEHEQIGVVDQRLAKLDALTHTLRVGTHRPVRSIDHAHCLQYRLGPPTRLGPGEPTQPGRDPHQLPP